MPTLDTTLVRRSFPQDEAHVRLVSWLECCSVPFLAVACRGQYVKHYNVGLDSPHLCLDYVQPERAFAFSGELFRLRDCSHIWFGASCFLNGITREPTTGWQVAADWLAMRAALLEEHADSPQLCDMVWSVMCREENMIGMNIRDEPRAKRVGSGP